MSLVGHFLVYVKEILVGFDAALVGLPAVLPPQRLLHHARVPRETVRHGRPDRLCSAGPADLRLRRDHAVLYLGGLALHSLLGIDIMLSIVVLAVATGAYTITGGLRPVI